MMTRLGVSEYRTTSGLRAVLSIICENCLVLIKYQFPVIRLFGFQEVGLLCLTKADFWFLADSFVRRVLPPFLFYSCLGTGSRAIYLSQLLYDRLHDDS